MNPRRVFLMGGTVAALALTEGCAVPGSAFAQPRAVEIAAGV